MDEPEQQPRGVHNPQVVDLITEDPATARGRAGDDRGASLGQRPRQLRQLEAKFNAYLEYVLGGHMAKQYPDYAERPVRFQLDCAENLRSADQAFFTAMSNFAAAEGIRLMVRVMQRADS